MQNLRCEKIPFGVQIDPKSYQYTDNLIETRELCAPKQTANNNNNISTQNKIPNTNQVNSNETDRKCNALVKIRQ